MAYRRILVGTDFSEPAREAARLAGRLAEGGAAVARTVHVVAPMPPVAGAPRLGELPGPAAFPPPDLAALRERAAAWHREHVGAGDAVVRVGGAASEMAREAKEWGADILVVGAKGQSALERLLLGSTAADALTAVDTDVLVARGAVPGPPAPVFRRVLVATALAKDSSALGRAGMEMAQRWGAELLAVHVVDRTMAGMAMGPDDAPAELEARIRDSMGGRARAVLARGRPAPEIRQVVQREGVDLLVVGNHAAGRLERLLLGSTSRDLTREAPCSVLLVRT